MSSVDGCRVSGGYSAGCQDLGTGDGPTTYAWMMVDVRATGDGYRTFLDLDKELADGLVAKPS